MVVVVGCSGWCCWMCCILCCLCCVICDDFVFWMVLNDVCGVFCFDLILYNLVCFWFVGVLY